MIKYDHKAGVLTFSYPTVKNPDDLFRHLASCLMRSSDDLVQNVGADIYLAIHTPEESEDG